MSNDVNGPTNGGSKKYKVDGGELIIDTSKNEVKIPPEGSMKIELPKDPKDFISIPLVPDREIEEGQEK